MSFQSTRVEPVSATTDTLLAETVESSARGTFDERWAAWQARGAAHERSARRKIGIAAPVVALAAAAVYAFLFR